MHAASTGHSAALKRTPCFKRLQLCARTVSPGAGPPETPVVPSFERFHSAPESKTRSHTVPGPAATATHIRWPHVRRTHLVTYVRSFNSDWVPLFQHAAADGHSAQHILVTCSGCSTAALDLCFRRLTADAVQALHHAHGPSLGRHALHAHAARSWGSSSQRRTRGRRCGGLSEVPRVRSRL